MYVMVTALYVLPTETITHIHLENREASLGAQMISRNDLSGEKGSIFVSVHMMHAENFMQNFSPYA